MLPLALRTFGTAAGIAIFAVVLPYEWMNAIHTRIGMGRRRGY